MPTEAGEPVAAPEAEPVEEQAPAEPVVRSLTPEGLEATEEKPRRQGWWQRKGFF